jgi:hypothetical protein
MWSPKAYRMFGTASHSASWPEAHQVGLYFLFGEDEESAKPQVYIGESEGCFGRIMQHHQRKDFWNRAVTVISRTQRLDKAQSRWLEWFSVREAARIGRFRVENRVDPSEPYITEPARADLLDSFETIKILLATLGFPLFEEVHRPDSAAEMFYCKGRGASGQGEYVEDGFLVLAGSTSSKSETPSAQGSWVTRVRDRLLQSGILSDAGEQYVFAEDHLFDTPSAAAVAVLGRNANGWTEWRDQAGRTLDELKRQTADSVILP